MVARTLPAAAVAAMPVSSPTVMPIGLLSVAVVSVLTIGSATVMTVALDVPSVVSIAGAVKLLRLHVAVAKGDLVMPQGLSAAVSAVMARRLCVMDGARGTVVELLLAVAVLRLVLEYDVLLMPAAVAAPLVAGLGRVQVFSRDGHGNDGDNDDGLIHMDRKKYIFKK